MRELLQGYGSQTKDWHLLLAGPREAVTPVEVFVEISSRFGNVWLQVDDFQRFFRDVCFVMSCYFLLVWSSVSSSILLPIRLYFGSGCYSWHSEIARASYLQIVRSLVPQFDDYCGYVRCWGPMAAITDHWTTCYNSGYMIYYKLEDNPRWLPSSSEDGHLWKTLKYIYIYIEIPYFGGMNIHKS